MLYTEKPILDGKIEWITMGGPKGLSYPRPAIREEASMNLGPEYRKQREARTKELIENAAKNMK